ncbi:hypothetical protein L873DRAFT_1806758 [Choiromyces venosus 120613-1]|uniref:Uncharacterized protein n=1 Tax=Choiromyces venosus 120613-1 TaxID=1336337 RepID=A0A3N4JLZ7_9PEZI|nr:hypothetical protein L873DRAFT_1806758 [Choiromyces venosus 120613-1]
MAGLAGLPTCRPDHGSDWPLGITDHSSSLVMPWHSTLAIISVVTPPAIETLPLCR